MNNQHLNNVTNQVQVNQMISNFNQLKLSNPKKKK